MIATLMGRVTHIVPEHPGFILMVEGISDNSSINIFYPTRVELNKPMVFAVELSNIRVCAAMSRVKDPELELALEKYNLEF